MNSCHSITRGRRLTRLAPGHPLFLLPILFSLFSALAGAQAGPTFSPDAGTPRLQAGSTAQLPPMGGLQCPDALLRMSSKRTPHWMPGGPGLHCGTVVADGDETLRGVWGAPPTARLLDRVDIALGPVVPAAPQDTAPKRRHPSISFGIAPGTRPAVTSLAGVGLALLPFDPHDQRWIQGHLRGQALDNLSSAGNTAGSAGGLAALGATYLLGSRYDKETAGMAASAALESVVVTEGIKWVVGRQRPSQGYGIHLSPFSGAASFPSGHSSFSFALATVYGRRYPRYRWLAYSLAGWVAFSRVQSNHHFLSDVLVGSAVGINSGERAIDGNLSISQGRF